MMPKPGGDGTRVETSLPRTSRLILRPCATGRSAPVGERLVRDPSRAIDRPLLCRRLAKRCRSRCREVCLRVSQEVPVHIERLLVLGGASGMGRWLVERVFGRDPKLDIVIADIDPDVVEIARRLTGDGFVDGVHIVSGAPVSDALPDIATFDAVLVAVPMDAVPQVAADVVPFVRSGALVFDVCSAKSGPLRTLLAAAGGRLSIVGTHPLFGPAVPSLVGQPVVICPTVTADQAHVTWLIERFERYGASVTLTTDPEEHDRYMSFVQVLTHFVLITFLRTLGESEVKLGRAWAYQTPPFRFLAGFAGRVMSLDTEAKLELYARIQMDAFSPQVRDLFAVNARELARVFATGDVGEVKRALKHVHAYLEPDDSQACQAITGRAISAEQAVAGVLHGYRATQELCALEIGRSTRVGIMQDVSPVEVTYLDCLAPLRGSGPFALVHTEEARSAARALGFAAQPPVQRTVPRQALLPLGPAETRAWLEQNVRHHRRSLTLELPRGVEPSPLAGHLVRMLEDIVDCTLVDVYFPDREPDIQRATYEMDLYGGAPVRPTLRALETIVSDLGFGASWSDDL